MKNISLKIVSVCLLTVMLLTGTVRADGVMTSGVPDGSVEADAPVTPSVSAQSFILMDLKTGDVILSRDEKMSLPIASTTKMMTALVVVENVALDTVVTVDAEACGIEGSSVDLYKGERVSVEDLLYALMLESANDAAVCLARAVSGSVEAFADLMNERAAKLGMKGTHFKNPHGLEDSEHYSTAYDQALLWQEAMKNATLRCIVGTKTYKMVHENGEDYRFFSNHNKLLKSYDPCFGGKTGFTKAAGRCLVTVSSRDGIELVAITLNAPDDWKDHEALFEYGFSLYTRVRLAEPGAIRIETPVVGGVATSTVITNPETLEIPVRDISGITSRVEAPRFLYAPVLTDKRVGRVVFYYNGHEIASLELFPLDEVEMRPEEPGFFKKIWNFFFGK